MYFMMENLIVDSYHEQQAQDEFFKARAAEMKQKRELKEDEDDAFVDVGPEFGKAAANAKDTD